MQTEADLKSLLVLHYRSRSFRAGSQIYGPHDDKTHVYNITSGWVSLSHGLPDGRRQISQFLTTGALFGYRPEGQAVNGEVATALDEVTVCAMPNPNLTALLERQPALNRRLIWMLGRDNLVTSHRLTSVGQAKAVTRVANLLLELLIMATGRSDHQNGVTIRLPLTQAQIADATGLTPIHVNRMVKQLREEEIIDFHNGQLHIKNFNTFRLIGQLSQDIEEIWLN
jgi:CRP-like cAMP-binding protein